MQSITFADIDEVILVEMLHYLSWYELVQLQLTSKLFLRIISDRKNSSIWHMCYRYLTFSNYPYRRSINWLEKVFESTILTSGNPLSITSIPIDVRRSGHSLSILEERSAVVFGGMCMSNTFSPSFYVRDLENPPCKMRTVSTGQTPTKRWLHSSNTLSTEDKEVIVIFGGFSDEPELYCNDLYMVTVDSENHVFSERVEASGDIVPPRCGHTTVNISDKKLLLFGGYGGDYFNDMYALEVSSEKGLVWKEIAPTGRVPNPRYCHSAVFAHGKMYIVGGWDEVKFYNDVHVYDTTTNTWSEMQTSGAVPRPLCQCSSAYFPPSYRFTDDKFLAGTNIGYLMIFGGAYRTNMVREKLINLQAIFVFET